VRQLPPTSRLSAASRTSGTTALVLTNLLNNRTELPLIGLKSSGPTNTSTSGAAFFRNVTMLGPFLYFKL